MRFAVHRPGNRLRPGTEPVITGAGGSELPGLLQVPRRGVPPGPPPRLLLNGEVPHVPGIRAVPQQRVSLRGGRLKTIPGHANTILKVPSAK